MRPIPFLLVAGALCAQNTTRLQTGYNAIQPAHLEADLTFLSSDALEGRRSLERGSEVAIQWIASQFAAAGLKPAVGDSYLQPVPLIEYTVDRNGSAVAIRIGENAQTFQAPDATIVFPHEGQFSGPVVFAGYGITAPELNYDDYKGIDARGKVVLYF